MEEATSEIEPIEPRDLLPCPECGEVTDSLKQFQCLDRCVFFGLGAHFQHVIHRACPACMRRFLWRRCLANVLTANVVWPFVVLPVHLVSIARSNVTGHSRAVIERVTPVMAVASEKERNERLGRYAITIFSYLFCWYPNVGLVPCVAACWMCRRATDWTGPASKFSILVGLMAQIVFRHLTAAGIIRWP